MKARVLVTSKKLLEQNPDLRIPPTCTITFLWPCGPLIGDPIDVGITIQELFEEFDKYKEHNNRSNPMVLTVNSGTAVAMDIPYFDPVVYQSKNNPYFPFFEPTIEKYLKHFGEDALLARDDVINQNRECP